MDVRVGRPQPSVQTRNEKEKMHMQNGGAYVKGKENRCEDGGETTVQV